MRVEVMLLPKHNRFPKRGLGMKSKGLSKHNIIQEGAP